MDNWEILFDDINVMDGPYQDVHCGQTIELLTGFNAISLEPTIKAEKSSIALGDFEYMFVSEVSYMNKLINSFCVLNIGFNIAVGYSNFKGAVVGSYLIGQGFLFVSDDNLWYNFGTDPTYPPLVYTWQINRIRLNTTPYITVTTPVGNKTQERDQSRLSFVESAKTDVWEDLKKYGLGSAQYVLHCTLLDIPPKFTLTNQ